MLLACQSQPVHVLAEGEWQRLADMPRPVFAAAGSLSGDRLIVTGGMAKPGVPSGTIQVLDLTDERWSTPATLNHPRLNHAQITLNDGRVLVLGGQTIGPGGFTDLDTCEVIAADGSAVEYAPPLPAPMAEPTVHRLADGQVIAIGGTLACIYDPAVNDWGESITLRQPRRAHASTLMPDGLVIVVGGVERDSLERIDIARGSSCLLKARLPHPLDDTAAIALPDGRVWIVAGQDGRTGETTDRTWLLRLGERSALVDGPRLDYAPGVADHQLVHTSRGVIVIGGESQQLGNDTELPHAWRLDLANLTVRQLTSAAAPHDDAVAVAYEDSLIVLGGTGVSRFFGLLHAAPVARVERLRLEPADRAFAHAQFADQ